MIVVGGGNAAFCAALAAREQGATVADARGRARGRIRRQQPLHRGRRCASPTTASTTSRRWCPTSPTQEIAEHRFRHLHRGPVLRRHGAGDADTAPIPTWSSCWSRKSFDTMLLDARQGRALHPDLRPAGVQDRRQVQVLGRPHGRGGRRRAGPRRDARPTPRTKRGIEIRYAHARAEPAVRRRARVGRARPARRRRERSARQGGRARLRRLRGQPRDGARAISGPAGTSPRCAARASTPATASAWRSTSAPRRTATGRAATRCGWERNAPEFGDLAVGDQFQKHSYPFGVLINADGKRFVDEGADFRNYTYAKYGRVVLEQPGQFAWQIFDAKVDAAAARRVPHPPGHQGHAPTRSRSSPTKLEGVERRAVPEDHRRVQRGGAARTSRSIPTSRTAARTDGLAIDKSNWANTLDTPPFEAYAVDLRHHLHLRRPAHRHRRRRCSTPTYAADPGPLCGGRAGRRPVLLQLSRRHRPHRGRGVRPHRRDTRGRTRGQELNARIEQPWNSTIHSRCRCRRPRPGRCCSTSSASRPACRARS